MPDHDEHLSSLGAWIRQRRKALGLTQAALAERVGCSVVTIRKWEREVARPARATAARLAGCLDIPPADRPLFLHVARGERSADRLAGIRAPSDPDSRASIPAPSAPLPLDTIPTPAPLPPNSRMPLRRNPLFVGRDTDLRQVAQVLHAGTPAAIGQVAIVAATGLGGIGKTQLACEFVHRYGQFFAGGVFWLSFADPAAVPAEVAACGGAEGMRLSQDFERLPLEDQVRLVLSAWKEAIPRLLIFDNCAAEALLEQWLPTHGGCRVLLTSRRHHWNPALGVQVVPLDVLPRRESIALLGKFRPDLSPDDADLAAIAETLGDLPLALHLAGSFLAHYRYVLSPAQYRARLHTPTLLDDRSLHAAGLSPTQHVQHVARTFAQSYERLDPTDPTDALARTLLAHAACCAPGEPLPRAFLRQTLDVAAADPECGLLAEDALTHLIDLGLIDTDAAGNLRLHRLVVAFVQVVLGDAAAQAVVEATMLRVVEDLNEGRNPQPLLAVQPHLRFLTEVALARADARTAALCHALGVHLWLLGVYEEAQHYHEQALAIRQRALRADHPDIAGSLRSLGNVLYDQGQYAEAQRYHEQALAIRQRVLGDDHPDTAQSLNNLGNALDKQGQYAAAQGYHEQALAIWQRVLGPEHPLTATSLNNLGNVLRHQGAYAAAQDYLEAALTIRQRALGADHPDTALSLNNLGTVFSDQGQYADAQHAFEQTLAILQRVLGREHPATATILHNLGEVLQAQGQYAEAQRYLEQALAIREHVLGRDHPDTARSLRAVGTLLHAQGQVAQAHHSLDQALTIFTQRLGPQHPDTDQTCQRLAALDGDPPSAERGW
ncbi:MAG TPA: FxSxx-COOH system tetratricopeptide repeat protein [Herpetosiphonaceae bacterium]